jgi:hypothetical protein
VLIAKANVNGEINSCIIDGKLYKNKLEKNKTIFLLNLSSAQRNKNFQDLDKIFRAVTN